jgi:hypothetical protein
VEELAFLQSHQCDEAQGYYFGRPMPSQEFATLLERGLLETVAAEDLERRIAVLERDLAESAGRTGKLEMENARLRKLTGNSEATTRTSDDAGQHMTS